MTNDCACPEPHVSPDETKCLKCGGTNPKIKLKKKRKTKA